MLMFLSESLSQSFHVFAAVTGTVLPSMQQALSPVQVSFADSPMGLNVSVSRQFESLQCPSPS